MRCGVLLFFGVLFSFATSWYGMVLYPQLQFGKQDVEQSESTGQTYPLTRSGLANQGKEIYRAQGCVYCHSQQVQPKELGPDFKRGWGVRRSVAADYLYDQPVFPGNLRVGPDLANIGVRQTNTQWHLIHLYNPRINSPGSIMPSYPFLFTKRKISLRASSEALPLEGTYAVEHGFEVVPSPAAQALVSYLLSLRSDTPLFEAPLFVRPVPKVDTNAPPADAGTNVNTNVISTTPSAKP